MLDQSDPQRQLRPGVGARRLPLGAEPGEGGSHLRLWAPGAERVALVRRSGEEAWLEAEGDGHHQGWAPGLGPGDDYGFRLDGEDRVRPDPASRWQPEGPDGWSRVVDPAAFRWSDGGWAGARLPGQVLYELHVGTFTREGTFAALEAELPRLRDLGVTAIELMPVAEFAGRWGWGYDGVALWAPSHRYGGPDGLRRLVDRAHALGLGVILDVVYNHFGPEGSHVLAFAPDALTEEGRTDWGARIDFDPARSPGLRELMAGSAAQWIAEYHLDGLRLDSTQDLHDESPEHVLAEIARAARRAAGGRDILLVAEDGSQDARRLRPLDEPGGQGMDAVWADEIHHAAVVAATGRRPGYLRDHDGSAQELLSAVRRGWLFQGQRSGAAEGPRGSPALDHAPSRFVAYLETHDQVATVGNGRRLHRRTSPGEWRALTALLLLGPATPMLFQGQEWASDAPWVYFADMSEGLRASVRDGRRDFLRQFATLAAPEMAPHLPDATDPATVEACRLGPPPDTAPARAALALHRDLLRLRREDPAIREQGAGGLEGAVLGERALLLRFRQAEGRDRLLLVNLGGDLERASWPEPLLAPPAGASWRLLWSSEHPDYGGEGTPPVESEGRWSLPGRAAVLMGAEGAAASS